MKKVKTERKIEKKTEKEKKKLWKKTHQKDFEGCKNMQDEMNKGWEKMDRGMLTTLQWAVSFPMGERSMQTSAASHLSHVQVPNESQVGQFTPGNKTKPQFKMHN